ncbi:20S proteasome subunit [Lentinula edodes]|uniref:20S proteasome subunit n=2 Tax=Lentinula TaxID=5352 RepID=A0A1Q3DWS6_LENED|nr:20S proteasome subunit [Lentinula edodes]
MSQVQWEEEFEKYRATPEFKILNHSFQLEDFKRIFYMEWGHRVLGRLIGVAFVGPLVFFAVKKRISKPLANKLGGLALLIGAQGGLGWYMVKSGLDDALMETPGAVPRVSQYRLAAHLGLALLLYAGMFSSGLAIVKEWKYATGAQWMGLTTSAFNEALNSPAVMRFKARSWVLTGLIFLTALSDGSDKWWRNVFENPTTVQFNHRVLAMTSYLGTTLLFLRARMPPSCFADTLMEAAIYDDFDVYSPFDFDIALDTTIVQSSQSIHAAGVLDSPFALPPNIPASPDTLPSDIHANNITYSFGVQYVHETDLWNSCFAHFKRQSRFCFAPRKIFDQLHQLTSPVDKILGTNACPSSMDIVLIQQHIKTLEKQYKTLEDDLCVLRLVLQQLSKEEWALANYMDLHRSLLVSSDQRLAFIAPRVPSVSMSPSQVYIKYIAFEFTSENTDLKLLPAAKYTIRFPVVQSLGPTLDRIEELIEAGDRPSTGEACKIQEILQVAEPAYRNVGQNIFALENVTDRVELELRFIHQNIFLHSALLAPINRVPDEVLREIFSRCFVLAEESLEESDPVLVPFVLGAVNTRWRSIVKLCPLLWSAVRIYLDISMFPSHALSVLSVWLKRAGSTEPLSLKIIFRNSWLSSSYYSNNDKNRSDLQMRVEANIAITIAILRKSAFHSFILFSSRMFRNTYDSDNTVFSPQGRLHQVEYALEAVKQGSAAVGLRSKTHSVLLALKRSTGELASYQQKMFRIDDHVGIAIAGLTSDARVLSNFMRQQAMSSKMAFNRPVPVNRLVSAIADKAQVNTQEYGRRPYGVGFLVIGQDKSGPHLYEFSPSGNSYEYYAMSIGARSQSAKTYLEKHYESFADCSLEDLIKHGLHALRETLQQDKDLNVNNTSIGIVGAPSVHENTTGISFRILEGETIQPFLDTMVPKDVPATAPAPAATTDEDVQMTE